ncbi:Smr/MutS family protein [Candidatus Puniceispirillum sp.]|uniref:Smr/MutS family protein n=1 Tax=Candidatus Puniceispirillum sp. TaxID=2026719 RepID=UPI003F6A5100
MADERAKTDRTDEDDHVLWQRVTALVKPAVQQNRRYIGNDLNHQGHNQGRDDGGMSPSKRPQAGAKPRSANMVGFALPKTSANTSPKTSAKTSPVDLRAGETAGIDGGTQKRLFRGDVKIDARLDLHGYNAAQAQQKLTQFLSQAKASGYRCILVITGKGARGTGILRSAVPDWLKSAPLSQLVLAMAQAKPSDGGAGALYVLLRRQRERK